MVDIKELQARVKSLATQRDAIIREAGAEERKLEESYEKLRELDIENPENLSVEELGSLATTMQEELEKKLTLLDEQVTQGESLAEKYKTMGG